MAHQPKKLTPKGSFKKPQGSSFSRATQRTATADDAAWRGVDRSVERTLPDAVNVHVKQPKEGWAGPLKDNESLLAAALRGAKQADRDPVPHKAILPVHKAMLPVEDYSTLGVTPTVHRDRPLSDEELAKVAEPTPADPWAHRSQGMRCATCIWYVEKVAFPPRPGARALGRCRRNAPTFAGYPSVFSTDWCGEHRLDENKA